MITLCELIEEARNKTTAKSVAEVARTIGVTREQASAAKSHTRPLPTDAAVKLAKFLGYDPLAVIAANELSTEKKEDKRAFWTPFAEHARAAGIALALSLVTIFVTPNPAEARQMDNAAAKTLYYVNSRRLAAWLKERQLTRTLCSFFKRTQKALEAITAPSVAQI